jgi:hypothetical protein
MGYPDPFDLGNEVGFIGDESFIGFYSGLDRALNYPD